MSASPRRTQTLVQLTDELVAELDACAGKRGESRSALIRRALRDYLDADAARDADQRLVEGYTRIPDGEFDAMHEQALRASMRDLPW